MITLAHVDLETLHADLARLESAPVHKLPLRALERGLRDALIVAYKAEIAERWNDDPGADDDHDIDGGWNNDEPIEYL